MKLFLKIDDIRKPLPGTEIKFEPTTIVLGAMYHLVTVASLVHLAIKYAVTIFSGKVFECVQAQIYFFCGLT